MRVRTLLLVFVLLTLGACSGGLIGGPTPTPDPCGPSEIGKYLDAISGVSRRFDDAVTLASSTPRMSLATVVADMQAIRRDAQDLKVPACAERAKGALVAYMNKVIEAFTLFLGRQSDAEVSLAFLEAKQLMDKYTQEMSKMRPTP